MNYIDEPTISKKEKLIIKYKKKKINLPNCLFIFLLFLLLISIISIIELKLINKSLAKEKNIYLREYFYLKNELEKQEKIIKYLENNITLYCKELDQFQENYSHVCSYYMKKQQQYRNKRKEIYILDIDLSYKKMLHHSSILTSHSQFKQIVNYVKNKLNISDYYPVFKLLYKSSFDGKKGEDLMNQIYGKDNVIILIKIEDDIIFGGYFSENISSSKKVIDENCFLFSLNFKEKYNVKESDKMFAVYCKQDEFFGFGKDVRIINQCNKYKNVCNFPVNYEGTKNNNLINKGINPLIGNYKNFGVKEIEVFLVKYEEKL